MIEFRQVTKRYDSDHTALRQVNFGLERGELAFLTGHSGAGKSTLLKLIMVMERPSAGEVIVGGQVLNTLPRRQVPYIRRHIGVVFQNHQLLFDRTVFDNVAMPLEVMGTPARDIGRRVRAALDKVGLLSKEKMNPMQLSGGEQQRVGIARALILEPKLIICDEPVSALDVSVQAQVINLLKNLQRDMGLSLIFIAHDLSVVKHISDRVMVLYLGNVAENAPRAELFANPRHPYTQALMAAVPIPDPERERAKPPAELEGDLPSPMNPPSGCVFRTRCPLATDYCSREVPVLEDKTGAGHWVACHYVERQES